MPTPLEKFRAKYPMYNSIDDATLVNKITTKYPQYREVFAEQVVTEPVPVVQPTQPAQQQDLPYMMPEGGEIYTAEEIRTDEAKKRGTPYDMAVKEKSGWEVIKDTVGAAGLNLSKTISMLSDADVLKDYVIDNVMEYGTEGMKKSLKESGELDKQKQRKIKRDMFDAKYAETQKGLRPGSAKYYLSKMGETSLNSVSLMLTAGLPGFFAQVLPEAYYEQREGGISPNKAMLASGGKALTEVLTEKLPMKHLMKKGSPFVKRVMNAIITDVPGEEISTVVDWAIDQKTIDANDTLDEAVEKLSARMIDTGIISVGSVGGQAVLMHAADRTPKKKDKPKKKEAAFVPGEVEKTIKKEEARTEQKKEFVKTRSAISHIKDTKLRQQAGNIQAKIERYEGQAYRAEIRGDTKKASELRDLATAEAEFLVNVMAQRKDVPKTDLESEIQQQAKSVDEYIDTDIPLGMSVKDVSTKPLADDKVISPEQLGSESKDVEKRWKSAKGIKKPPRTFKAIEAIKNIKKAFTRKYTALDTKIPQHARVQDTLRQYESVPEYSKAVSHEVIKGFTAGLGPQKMDVFERNIILPDLMKDIKSGLYADQRDLPFGYKDAAEIQTDIDKYKKIADANPDIKEAIARRNHFFKVMKKDLVKNGLLPKEVLKDENYFHHQVLQQIALRDKVGTGLSSKDVRVRPKGWQKSRIGSSKDYNTQYVEAEFEVISQAISQLETAKAVKGVLGETDIAPVLKQEAKDSGIDNWRDLIPEGYRIWKPDPKQHFYKAMSVPEQILDAALYGEGVIQAQDLQEILAVAQGKVAVLPNEIADTLDNFRDFSDDNFIGALSKGLMSSWKQWVLLNPVRVMKYNINNLSGDFDIATAVDPRMMKEVPKAARDLYRQVRGKSMTPDMREAIKMGVIGSGLTVSEVPDISKAGAFQVITGEKPNLIEKYWNKIKDYTNYRENILRLAAYRYAKQQIAKGENIYWTSKKHEIDAIKDPDAKAAKLAREAIGDYGNISKAGQWLREHMMPFYSWIEVNAPRYVRLLANIPHEGGGVGKAGRLAGLAGKKTAWKALKLGVKANVLFMLVNLWNKTFFSEEEKELSDLEKKRLHLILGRKDDGSVLSLRFQGALSDALDWLDLQNYVSDAYDIYKGDLDVKKKAQDMAFAPINKIVQAQRPGLKTGLELATGYSLFPDIRRPMPIRDRAEHITRLVSMDIVYKYLAGKPTRSIDRELSNIIIYTSEPGEAAYYTIRSKAFDYLEDQGREAPRFKPTERQNALYYYKQAVKYGDEKAAKKYKKMYFELGGTKRGLKTSITRSAPLSFMPRKERKQFIKTLDKREKRVLKKAESWYYQTYKSRSRR